MFDGLSRNVSPQELGLDPLFMYNAAADDPIVQIVQLCNPTQRFYNSVLVCCCFDTLVQSYAINITGLNVKIN